MLSRKRNLDTDTSPGGSNKRLALKPPVASNTKMKVYVRVRPFNQKEIQGDYRNIVKILDDQMMVFDPKQQDQPFFFHGVKHHMRDINKKQNKSIQFIFDRVYGGECTNEDVYDCSIKDLLPSLLEGYNCSVFVYGATGAGKTFTMLGTNSSPGITYLTMLQLYNQIEQFKEKKNFELRISYLEVYNENVHDLLNPGSGALHLREDTVNGVIVAGMTLVHVTSASHLLEVLRQGNENRTQHPTDANAESSRSHAVFQVFIKMQNKDSDEIKFVKLTMIDLAGSERGAATNCSGLRFKEGSNINKSLLALGNCINNLADGVRHIPYRDSKLTRLLKDSLGGNCQTVMIACVGPTNTSYEDTYNTLKYATRAKNIKTKLTKNIMSINIHVDQYKNIVQELQNKISQLEKTNFKMPDLSAWKTKINLLFEEKEQIHQEFLNLRSKEKVLQWRIKHKNAMKERLAVFNNADEGMSIDRIESAVSQFECRIASLQGKMSQIWDKKMNNHEKIVALQAELEKEKVYDLLATEIGHKECLIQKMEEQTEKDHAKRLFVLDAVENDKREGLVLKLLIESKQYFTLLHGFNKATNAMIVEHNDLRSKIKGAWNVSWESSPSNLLKRKVDSLESFCSLSLDDLQKCTKPDDLLNKQQNNADLLIPVFEDEENDDEDEDENLTFVLNSNSINPDKIKSPLKPLMVNNKQTINTPGTKIIEKKLFQKGVKLEGVKVATLNKKLMAPTLRKSQRTTATLKTPKTLRNRIANKENIKL